MTAIRVCAALCVSAFPDAGTAFRHNIRACQRDSPFARAGAAIRLHTVRKRAAVAGRAAPLRTRSAGAQTAFVQTADMMPYLHAGKTLWVQCLPAPAGGAVRMFACRAVAYGRDGTAQQLVSPDGWRGLDGTAALRPRHSIGTGYFTAYAQDIDGEVYPFGFAEPGFDDGGWLPCGQGASTAGFSRARIDSRAGWV